MRAIQEPDIQRSWAPTALRTTAVIQPPQPASPKQTFPNPTSAVGTGGIRTVAVRGLQQTRRPRSPHCRHIVVQSHTPGGHCAHLIPADRKMDRYSIGRWCPIGFARGRPTNPARKTLRYRDTARYPLCLRDFPPWIRSLWRKPWKTLEGARSDTDARSWPPLPLRTRRHTFRGLRWSAQPRRGGCQNRRWRWARKACSRRWGCRRCR